MSLAGRDRLWMTNATPTSRRGAGTLAVGVSSVDGESLWESIEHRNENGALWVRVGFGRGSAVASSSWAAGQECAHILRKTTLRLPYFDLGDFMKISDAPLKIEIILRLDGDLQERSSTVQGDRDLCRPHNRREGAGGRRYQPLKSKGSAKIFATGNLDIKAWFADHGTTPAEETESEQFHLTVAKGEAASLAFAPPERVSVRVRLAFSKATVPARIGGVQQVEGLVPVVFVVATTLFDCAATIKDPELRIYARNRSTGGARCLSRGVGDEIVLHERFEWNFILDVRGLIPEPQTYRSAEQDRPGALIILLCERRCKTIGDSIPSCVSPRTTGAVGCAEVFSKDLVSCGTSGRWCPLQACSVERDRWCLRGTHRKGQYEGCVIGEALVAFAWIARPAAEALPRANDDRDEIRNRHWAQDELREASASDGGEIDSDRAPQVNRILDRSTHADHGIRTPRSTKHILFIHVWDALLPQGRPEYALYLTVKLSQRGSRGQRVSTKPARGRGGMGCLRVSSMFPFEASASGLKGRGSSISHFVWDEHLSLGVDAGAGEPSKDSFIALQLRDASVDYRTGNPTVAESESEGLGSFAARGRLRRTKDTSSSEGGSSCCQEITPAVHHLRLLPHATEGKGGRLSQDGVSECSEVAKVRMSTLLLTKHDAQNRGDEVAAFRQRKAGVAWAQSRTPCSPLSGSSNVTSQTSRLPALMSRRPARSRILLDLSAAGGLFRKFANSGSSAEIARAAELSYLEASGEPGHQLPAPITDEHGVVGALQWESKAKLAKGQLPAIAREYFPGYQMPEGNDAGESRLGRATVMPRGSPSLLSLEEFLAWLRGFPDDALGAAGLLVSPRTALNNTEMVMDQSTNQIQTLATLLSRSTRPGKELIGNWCTISFQSTSEAAAFDRVQLGWGEGCLGEETTESRWQHCTQMLRKDVRALEEALVEKEKSHKLRVQSIDATAEKDAMPVPVSRLSAGVERAHSAEDTRYHTVNMNVTNDKPLVTSCDVPAEHEEFVVALYLEQEASRLRVAARHLKDMLRWAGDVLCCDTTCIHARSVGVIGRYRRNGENVAISRQRSEDQRASNDQRRYLNFALLQQIKQVKGLQAEIAALQRRTAALLSRSPREQLPTLWIQRNDSNSGRIVQEEGDSETPRSALALVKRIRRAQGAARPPTAVKVGEIDSEEGSRGQTKESVGVASSPRLQESGAQSHSGQKGEADVETDLPPGSRTPMPVAFKSITCMPQRSPSVNKVDERLTLTRSAFEESGLELPEAFLGMGAGRLIGIALGIAQDGQEVNLATFVSAAATCCPIDRFTLHVFCTAGAAFEDVQELQAIGGLDTHTSNNSLWTAAVRAGVVDIERWAVAAVLWQIIHAVERSENRTPCSEERRCPGITAPPTTVQSTAFVSKPTPRGAHHCFRHPKKETPNVWSSGSGLDEIGTELGAARYNAAISSKYESTPANRLAFFAAAEARSLWMELLQEAFSLVIGRSTTSVVSASSGNRSSCSPSRRLSCGYTKGAEEILLAGATQEGVSAVNDPEHVGRRYVEQARYVPSHFGHALTQTLVQVGHGGPTPAHAAVLQTVTGPGGHLAESTRMELQLLYTYAIAGFAEGSGLGLKDVVDAVRIRRARVLSEQPVEVSLTTCGRYLRESEGAQGSLNCIVGIGFETRFSRFDKITGAPKADVSTEEERRLSVTKASAGEQQSLMGIPPELRELFHAAALAQAIRRRQRQQQRGCQSLESSELGSAEAQVVCVLNRNRSLESAAFAGGRTALHHAAARADEFLVRVLLERGCKHHLKDFEGKRACDLTRSLECLRLLGALKKAPVPLALYVGPRAEAPLGRREALKVPLPKDGRDKTRALISVKFSVSFRPSRADKMLQERQTPSTSPREVRDGREDSLSGAGGTWTEGIVRWFNVRNRVMYIEDVGERDRRNASNDKGAPDNVDPCPYPTTDGEDVPVSWSYDGQAISSRYQVRHALDVVLVSCLSPRGAELFSQLRAYVVTWKELLAAEMVDSAIDAAAEVGARCRLVLDEVVAEVVAQIAQEALGEGRCAVAAAAKAEVAAKSAAEAEVGSVVTATAFQEAQALVAARNEKPMTEQEEQHVTKIKREPLKGGRSQLPSAVASTPTETLPTRRSVHNVSAARKLNFQCIAIVTERATRQIKSADGCTHEERVKSETSLKDSLDKERSFLAKLRMEDGMCAVEVSGHSYLDVTADGRGTRESAPISLKGSDRGVQRVLDYHGVSLAECVQTFDVMQDMEDSNVVLEMLAAAVCQLSSLFIAEGVDFSSLDQSAQDALKTEVRGQLNYATRHDADAGCFVDWKVLRITMPAYGGVASVRVVKTNSASDEGAASDGGDELMVSPPPDGDGWLRPKDVMEELGNPHGTSSSLPRLPSSAVNIVVSLMRRNPCEVLSSLRPGTGADGRLALIGHVLKAPPSKDREGVIDGADDCLGIRCALEVAWDMETRGICVRRFSMETNEKRPRFVLRAVGVKRFSIAQLPVTLDDIDAIWDQPDIDETSASEETSEQSPGTTTTTSTEDNVEYHQHQQSPSDIVPQPSEDRFYITSAETELAVRAAPGVVVAIEEEDHVSPKMSDKVDTGDNGHPLSRRGQALSNYNEKQADGTEVCKNKEDEACNINSDSAEPGSSDRNGEASGSRFRNVGNVTAGEGESRTNSDKSGSKIISEGTATPEDRPQPDTVAQEANPDQEIFNQQVCCQGHNCVHDLQETSTGGQPDNVERHPHQQSPSDIVPQPSEDRFYITSSETELAVRAAPGVVAAIEEEDHVSPKMSDRVDTGDNGHPLTRRGQALSNYNEKQTDETEVCKNKEDEACDINSDSAESGSSDGIGEASGSRFRNVGNVAAGEGESRTNSNKSGSKIISEGTATPEDRPPQPVTAAQEANPDQETFNQQVSCQGHNCVHDLQETSTSIPRSGAKDDEEEIVHALARLEYEAKAGESSGRNMEENTAEQDLTSLAIEKSTNVLDPPGNASNSSTRHDRPSQR